MRVKLSGLSFAESYELHRATLDVETVTIVDQEPDETVLESEDYDPLLEELEKQRRQEREADQYQYARANSDVKEYLRDVL